MKTVETQAKTIDAAIANALAQLSADYDQVDVEIISEGGLMKKAKVRVTLKEQEKSAVEEKDKNTPQAQNPKSRQNASTATENIKLDDTKKAGTESPLAGKLPEKCQKCLDFITDFINLIGNDSKIKYEITDKAFNINIIGENVAVLIGRGGEVLFALQTIISTMAVKHAGNEHRRVYLNIEDYKERRTETLKALALKKAESVISTGRYIKLEPMNPRERAIIHSALQEVSGIRTYSTGKDPHRCLCIAPADSPTGKA